MSDDRSFPKKHRLHVPSEIDCVRKKGKRFLVTPLIVYSMSNGLVYPRLAIALTRRCGTSPTRSYIRRRIREFFRHNKTGLAGLDLFIFSNRDLSKLKRDDWTGVIGKLESLLISQKLEVKSKK